MSEEVGSGGKVHVIWRRTAEKHIGAASMLHFDRIAFAGRALEVYHCSGASLVPFTSVCNCYTACDETSSPLGFEMWRLAGRVETI
jgi:hypothetical protein